MKYIFLFSLFIGFSSLGQNSLTSAKNAVDTLFFTNKEAGLIICDRMIPIALQNKDTFHITYFLDQAGEINRFQGNLYDAENQLRECLKYKKNWKDLKDLSLTHNNLGKTYKMMGEYDKALSHFMSALKLMEKDKNLLGQGFYLNNIASVFDDQQNYSKAIEYYNQSLKIKQETKDTAGIASSTYNLGISYFNLNKFEKALSFFQQSYSSASYQKDYNKKARALMSIGQTYQKMGKTTLAKDKLEEAYSLRSKMDDYILISRITNALSIVYLDLNNVEQAKSMNAMAMNMIQGRGVSDLMQESLFTRSAIFKKTNELDSALFYLETGNLYYDSLVTEANINAVANMEAKYNTEKNLRLRKELALKAAETTVALENAKLKILYLILGIVILIGVSLIGWVKYSQKRQNLLLINGQKALMEKQNQQLNYMNVVLESELEKVKISVQDKEALLHNVFHSPSLQELPAELLQLSPREKEVLSHLALGLSNEQLAETLFVSQTTIKTHLKRIFSKLLVKNRTEAVVIAHKYGIIGDSAA